ncbi:hypothetical protein [Arcticibacter tournemirensis]|nr:hypothetical protein [Arcticibacter tournemirensis]
MTFEEFFAKKKIDVDQLAKADHGLYTEFKSHFVLMGEKSFDHSKKFWFNKLRRLYHLQQPVKAAVTQIETQIASQAEPLSSPTIEQAPASPTPVRPPAFKPRFKAANAPAQPQASGEIADKQDEVNTGAIPAPAKRPPFKPKNVKPISGEPSGDAQTVESRPGQTEVSDTPVRDISTEASAQKPAYKPKFNIRNIPKKPAGTEEQAVHTTKEEIAPDLNDVPEKIAGQARNEAPGATKAAGHEEVKAKPAYKPRFNLKAISNKEEDKAATEPQNTPEPGETTNVQEPPTEAAEETAKGTDSQTSDKPAKPIYKPRFNAKNIKPKTED